MTIRMLFRGLLFYVGILLFMFSSICLISKLSEGSLVGERIPREASDSQIQIAILKNGFITLFLIGLEIISLLIMSFFKDWDEK